MPLSLSWSWIVGVIAALIVIASIINSRRRRDPLEPPALSLDDSGTFPVLTPPEEPAEILTPPEDELPITTEALDDVPREEGEAAERPAELSAELPMDAVPPDQELDEALDDALDRVVK